MNIFETVKSSVTTRQAAERYGIRVNRNGMAQCPFHNDRTPSMKVDERFHCFGCQADGDVIDFVARLFDLPVKDAAVKLADDFGIDRWSDGLNRIEGSVNPVKKGPAVRKDFEALKKRVLHVYSEYLYLLNRWRTDLAPASVDEEWNPRFMEALQKQDQVEYILDTLLDGTKEEAVEMVSAVAPQVDALEERVMKEKAKGGSHGRTDRM